MEIKKQYLIQVNGQWQILFDCGFNNWFCTSNGAFNQREMYIISISKEEAEKLIFYDLNKPLFEAS